MPFWLVNASTSPAGSRPHGDRGRTRLVSSASVTVTPGSTAAAAPPSVKAVAPAVVVTTGGSLKRCHGVGVGLRATGAVVAQVVGGDGERVGGAGAGSTV